MRIPVHFSHGINLGMDIEASDARNPLISNGGENLRKTMATKE